MKKSKYKMKDNEMVNLGNFSFVGRLGHMSCRKELNDGRDMYLPKGKEDEIHNYITYVNMINEYLENEFLNNEHFQKLDINLKKFLSDVDYYWNVYYNHKEEYHLINQWFYNELVPLWSSVFGNEEKTKSDNEKILKIYDFIMDRHWDFWVDRDIDVKHYKEWFQWLYNEVYTDDKSVGDMMRGKVKHTKLDKYGLTLQEDKETNITQSVS